MQLDQPRVTIEQLEERKSRFRNLSARSEGIVNAVGYILETGRSSKRDQAKKALLSFADQAARVGIKPHTLDYKLVFDKFTRLLSGVVGSLDKINGEVG